MYVYIMYIYVYNLAFLCVDFVHVCLCSLYGFVRMLCWIVYVFMYFALFTSGLSQQSTLTAKLGSLDNSCLQAVSSTGNRFYRQELPCSESI